MTEAERNQTKWMRFLDTSVTALREKAEEEWNRAYPQQLWNINDPNQINVFVQIEQAACNGRLPNKSREHLNAIQNRGADFQNWDTTLLAYFLNYTRCLDLRNRNQQLYQAVDTLRDLRNQLFHIPSPKCITDCKLQTVYQDYDNCIVVLGVSVTVYQQKLKDDYERKPTAASQWPWKQIAIIQTVVLFKWEFHEGINLFANPSYNLKKCLQTD